MADMELEAAEEISANSEMRIIALELMKLAIRQKKPFHKIAAEYISNVYLLKHMLDGQKE
ncbi:MAG: hypothetical protein PHS02_00485 [Candidatus ainarchaeum sp.]|nr:hypothetical protein [Candidatus ainarchaeum sp.]